MKIGFTASAFDLLHAGHIIMLKECKEHCDYLIVGLHINPAIERENKNVPVQSVVERYIQLRATKYVDEIIPYQTEADLLNILQTQNVNIRFLGEEYSGKQFTGLDYCHENSIEIHFNSRKHPFSSSELRRRVSGLAKIDSKIIEITGIPTPSPSKIVSLTNIPITWESGISGVSA
jgi:glycerol-3-phosphate cytidylyltransferase